MIRFLKEIYLTGFALLFRHSRNKQIGYKVGASISIITLVELFNIMNIASCVEMFSGKRFLPHFAEPEIILIVLVTGFLNAYVLFSCGYGIKFEREFDHLKKSRRVFLTVSCVVVLLVTIAFSIYSISAHRRFVIYESNQLKLDSGHLGGGQ